MRIKKLWINEYKNLRDFNVNFGLEPFPKILVGKNGSGKSNLLEVILEIFMCLFEREELYFEFCIEYKLSNNDDIKIEYNNNILKLNENVVENISEDKLPKRILTYYSGHNKKISNYLEKSLEKYRGHNNFSVTMGHETKLRKIFGFEQADKNLILLSLILNDSNALNDLNISTETLIGKLILKDQRKNSTIENGEEFEDYINRFRNIKLKETFNKLLEGNRGERTAGDEGFIYDKKEYKVTLYKDIFEEYLENNSVLELFKNLNDLRAIGMLKEIELFLLKRGVSGVKSSDYSDGETQLLFLKGLTELFRENDTLILLDEPDAFLHPEWQIKLIDNVDKSYLLKNQILMTTHNVSTIIGHYGKVNLFKNQDEGLINEQVRKKEGVQELSSGLILYNEGDPIISALSTQEKHIFLTEGSTDPIALKYAWEKLYPGEVIPFVPIFSFSDEYLGRMLKEERVHSELNGKKLFGLFDFDQAYSRWSSIRTATDGELEENNPYKGLCRKLTNKDVYAFLLPVLNEEGIKKLVIKDEGSLSTFEQESRYSLELAFYNKFTGYEEYYKEVPCVGGTRIKFKDSSGNKTKFAEEVIPNLPVEAFEVFRPMFEKVKEIIEA